MKLIHASSLVGALFAGAMLAAPVASAQQHITAGFSTPKPVQTIAKPARKPQQLAKATKPQTQAQAQPQSLRYLLSDQP
jgi:hypothetical protein